MGKVDQAVGISREGYRYAKENMERQKKQHMHISSFFSHLLNFSIVFCLMEIVICIHMSELRIVCYLWKDMEISNLEEGRALNSWLIGL